MYHLKLFCSLSYTFVVSVIEKKIVFVIAFDKDTIDLMLAVFIYLETNLIDADSSWQYYLQFLLLILSSLGFVQTVILLIG